MKTDGTDGTVTALRRVLDQVSRQANVTASNIANVDTPGYKALRIEFDQELGKAAHDATPQSSGRIVEAATGRIRNDGNTVDIDQEMTELAKLQGRYSAAAKMLSKRFALLQYAVSSRGQG